MEVDSSQAVDSLEGRDVLVTVEDMGVVVYWVVVFAVTPRAMPYHNCDRIFHRD